MPASEYAEEIQTKLPADFPPARSATTVGSAVDTAVCSRVSWDRDRKELCSEFGRTRSNALRNEATQREKNTRAKESPFFALGRTLGNGPRLSTDVAAWVVARESDDISSEGGPFHGRC